MSAEVLEHYSLPPERYDPLANHPDPEALYLSSLRESTTLAGREKPFTWELDDITSEGALHRYRAQVEVEALINLAERGPVAITITEEEKISLRTLYSKDVFDPEVVVRYDHLGHNGKPPFEHDVKSVEVYVGDLLDEHDMSHLKEWVHFGMTSEDTNNLAYNLMLRDATNNVLVPSVGRVADRLAHLATIYADTPTLGITHAQKASPTTAGKQFAYLLGDITEVASKLDGMRLTGKFSGAVGNHNPMSVLFPDFDYDAYSKDFVESLGFEYASVQNQRNNHLSVKDMLDTVNSLAVVGKDATDNVWLKILGNQLSQRLVAGEKGSSTMSHKINPWRLENAESLFEQALALMSRAPEGLVASRHERDLSDHGWERAYGDMIGRVVAGYNYFAVQLDRLSVDEVGVREVLNGSAEVLSELVQTAGRVSGDPDAYDTVVRLTQGKKLDMDGIRGVIDEALPDGDIKDRSMHVTPDTYVGVAGEKAREAVLGWNAAKLILKRGVLDESTSIDAVFFDLDDTLHFGAKDEVVAKLTTIFGEFESGFSDEEIAEFAKMHDFKNMVKAMVTEHNLRVGARKLTVEDFDQVNARVTGSFDHLFYAPKESKEVIRKIRESGKATGLVTTRGSMSLDRVLDLHGFSDLFDVIVGGGDVKRRKPHPEPLAIALGKIGVSAERSMYVGDDQDADIGAAKAIGMKTALVGQAELDAYGPRPDYHWQNLQPLSRLYGR